MNREALGEAARWLAATAATAVIAACGGGNAVAPAPGYQVQNLVSDNAVAGTRVDPDLVNAWGLAFNPAGFSWVANNATSRSTLYDGRGQKQSLVVSVPAAQDSHPTGIVFNDSTEFIAHEDGRAMAAPFIFAGENGTLSAWAPDVESSASLTVYDGRAQGKAYKGLAIGSVNGVRLLYATDFRNGRIDVFNTSFELVSPPGDFVDPQLPAGYAPFGIQAIGNRVYVTYAQHAAGAADPQTGPQLGALAVFDTAGNLVRHLGTGGALNAPWGIALAPAGFGDFRGRLLVANFGDGRVNAFDPVTGALAGSLLDRDARAVSIDGLWAIAFGNGLFDQPANTLFFTAGPAHGTHGLFGRIDVTRPL